jgi:hypothetical protein
LGHATGTWFNQHIPSTLLYFLLGPQTLHLSSLTLHWPGLSLPAEIVDFGLLFDVYATFLAQTVKYFFGCS